MRRPRFYTEQSLSDELELDLESGPSQHIGRTLRMRPGDVITLFDGHGGEYPAHIIAIDKRQVRVKLETRADRELESPLNLALGIAVSRGDRMDWVVQKATELGVNRIAPLTTERTGQKLPVERVQKKRQHWLKIAASACEQCGRNRLPDIAPIQPLADWAANCDSAYRLVLHHRNHTSTELPSQVDSAALLIGPEGGFADTEIELARQSGFIELTLGPRVLRTETAPLAAITLLQSRWGDMQIA